MAALEARSGGGASASGGANPSATSGAASGGSGGGGGGGGTASRASLALRARLSGAYEGAGLVQGLDVKRVRQLAVRSGHLVPDDLRAKVRGVELTAWE